MHPPAPHSPPEHTKHHSPPDHTDPHTLADLFTESIHTLAQALDAEHAVRGIDALDERAIQHHLATTLRQTHSLGVQTETPYPSPEKNPRDRQRCDLAITPSPSLTIANPTKLSKYQKSQPLPPLFAHLTPPPPPPPHRPSPLSTITKTDTASTIPPEQACWIELKVIGQHHLADGIAQPNHTYTSTLTKGPADDAAKLAKDPHIRHAAALIILFTETNAAAIHDLTQLAHRCLDRQLPVAMPITRTFNITDRIGNTAATLCLLPIQTTHHDDTDDDIN